MGLKKKRKERIDKIAARKGADDSDLEIDDPNDAAEERIDQEFDEYLKKNMPKEDMGGDSGDDDDFDDDDMPDLSGLSNGEDGEEGEEGEDGEEGEEGASDDEEGDLDF